MTTIISKNLRRLGVPHNLNFFDRLRWPGQNIPNHSFLRLGIQVAGPRPFDPGLFDPNNSHLGGPFREALVIHELDALSPGGRLPHSLLVGPLSKRVTNHFFLRVVLDDSGNPVSVVVHAECHVAGLAGDSLVCGLVKLQI